jgi:peroxiredoxin
MQIREKSNDIFNLMSSSRHFEDSKLSKFVINQIYPKMKTISKVIFFILLIQNSFAQIAEKPEDISPILIGEKIPQATLYNSKNEAFQLNSIIDKPTVLIFYRGGWCPYCNVHLSELVKIEPDIIKMGYQIIAISPDDFQNLDGTSEKIKMNYRLFSDKNADFIKAIGIGFKAPESAKSYISKTTKGLTTEVLPVPTVLIVDKNGEVLMEYISPNIKKRISGKMLLSVLQSI